MNFQKTGFRTFYKHKRERTQTYAKNLTRIYDVDDDNDAHQHDVCMCILMKNIRIARALWCIIWNSDQRHTFWFKVDSMP